MSSCKPYHCSVCGSPMVNAGNGSACPVDWGHDYSNNKLPKKVAVRHHAMVSLGLEEAKMNPTGPGWILSDGCKYQEVKRIQRVLNAWPKEVDRSMTLALCGHQILVLFKKDK